MRCDENLHTRLCSLCQCWYIEVTEGEFIQVRPKTWVRLGARMQRQSYALLAIEIGHHGGRI